MTDDQLALVPEPARAPERVQAAELPIARVVVDSPLSHLDRPFDYLVPADLDDSVVPGCRVKVRFAGRLVDGFCVERVAASEHEGLAWLAKAVSSEPVLRPDVLALARQVADHYAGTLSDVLRLAVPPRQARVEAAQVSVPPTALPDRSSDAWEPFAEASDFLDALAAGRGARAVWSALPGHDPARAAAQAVLATLHAGRGAVVLVPDARDVARWDRALTEVLGEGLHVVLTAAQKPAERYRSYLALARGQVGVALGTRAAAFAPVHDVGLVVIWDDGDDLYAEPRAPYPHAREVLLMRAHAARAGVLLGAYARTAEAQQLVGSRWAGVLEATPADRRTAWPRVEVTDGSLDVGTPVRLPQAVVRAIRRAPGAVLVQVPRRGYRSSLSCQQCREPARCGACQGPLAQAGPHGPLVCRWCGAGVDSWSCPGCGGRTVRSTVVGHVRTAEEFARTFAERTVVTSGGDTVHDRVDDDLALVLATPGAEPRVAGGYALVVLLDTWLMLARDDVRVVEESTRRWFNALSLAARGADAVAVGDAPPLQSLVRADPAGAAARELAERAETRLPPVGRLATVDLDPAEGLDLTGRTWTPHTEVLGPVPVADDVQRLILRCPRAEGAALSAALKTLQAERSAAKLTPLRVRVDPPAF